MDEKRSAAPEPTLPRMLLVVAVFVGVGAGVMALMGQEPYWSVFTGLGVVFALGMRKRWRDARSTAG